MFTGIIEGLGKVKRIEQNHSNLVLHIASPFTANLKVDQSIAHNGVCLTVCDFNVDCYLVTLIDETIKRTNFGNINIDDYVNLERCMIANSRLDGHIVQGHVDQVAKCVKVEDRNGSWFYGFEYDRLLQNITVSKGSICINGVSLTVVDSEDGYFSVAIIPYTYENTTFKYLKKNDLVNLEFDIIGKYVQKLTNGYFQNFKQ